MALASTIAEAAGILATAATAVGQVEDERELLRARVADLEERAPDVGRYGITPTWRTDWPVTSIELPERTKVVDDPERGQVLEVVTPAGQAKGFGAFAPIAPRDEIRYRMGVYFGPEFEWQNPITKGGGGKIGGLALSKPATSALMPKSNGGKRNSNGVQITRKADIVKQTDATLRFLWHAERRFLTYFYLPDLAHIGATSDARLEGTLDWRCWGWSSPLVGLNGPLRPRVGWNDLEPYIRLNDIGQRNGVLEVRLNGELGLRVTDLVYRTSPDVRISHLFPTWYHGGGEKDYPSVNNRVRLDGFEVLG
jgi:hypothetical protein